MLSQLLSHVVDVVVLETPCGFCRGRSTVDMIFVAWQLQEKCWEQHCNLYLAFIDLTKAFDTVIGHLLWGVLCKFGCPPSFLMILKEFHRNASDTRVSVGGLLSDPFDVNGGVKQGCILTPVIFNLFLVAVTLLFQNGISESDGSPLSYRLDGNLFNLHHFQVQTHVSTDYVFDVQYAGATAIPSHTALGLQNNLSVLAEAYKRAGLVVNVKKTEVLAHIHGPQPSQPSHFSVDGSTLLNTEQFTYLGTILTSV